MAELTGSEILAKALKNEGTDILFFLMGGPMLLAESSCIKEGIRALDVRHEQAAAFMAQAYSRVLQKPGVCMAASGPGVINLTTGIANALIDCAPVVAIGGSCPVGLLGRQVFQEIDQVAIMKPCTKWTDRVYNLKRIPEQVNNAFQKAMTGKPGPVYLDFPGDILYAKIEEDKVDWSLSGRPLLGARPMGEERQVSALIDALGKARQPIILTGSGVLWSQAWPELQTFVEATGIPFYTTPQGRGVLPDDHALSYMSMRSTAFRESDLILVIGTRMNYIIAHGAPPRFNPAATIARIDIDADEIASAPRRIDIGIVGDCKTVLNQLMTKMNGQVDPDRFGPWRKKLADGEAAKRQAPGANKALDDVPIHPLRLCDEVSSFMRRDAILVVDGQ
jgi:thiamine pyrophosphate-dependent acetolactate synthase large subunit-like protein